MICNKDCFHCTYDDCIYDGMDADDYKEAAERDRALKDSEKSSRQRKIAAKQKAYREANRDENRQLGYLLQKCRKSEVRHGGLHERTAPAERDECGLHFTGRSCIGMIWILVIVLFAATVLSLLYAFGMKDRADEMEEEINEDWRRFANVARSAVKLIEEISEENTALLRKVQSLQAALDKLAAEAREDAK